MSAQTKYKAIKNSPHKATINRLLVVGETYRKISEILKRDYQLLVSPKTLNYYHRDELDSLIVKVEEEASRPDEDTPAIFTYNLDLEKVEQNVLKLREADSSFKLKDSARGLAIESYVVLSMLTEEALKRHASGACRFPNDYLTKLVSLFGIMAK